MKLSSRLQACADLVRPGGTLADIGTDHGHLPIYLLKNNICTHVIAADLREKPLQFARQNASLYGVTEHIEFFLSDGLLDIDLILAARSQSIVKDLVGLFLVVR